MERIRADLNGIILQFTELKKKILLFIRENGKEISEKWGSGQAKRKS